MSLEFGEDLNVKGQLYPVYHAYGFGGAGLTLSPGVADFSVKAINKRYSNNKQQPILIIGAGVIGLSIARELMHEGYRNIQILSAFYTPGSETLIPHIKPVTKKDYFPSCVAGGYIMPVTLGVTPHSGDTATIIETAQQTWAKRSTDPRYASMVMAGDRISFLPVLPDQVRGYSYDAMAVNQLLGYELYPVQVNRQAVLGVDVKGQKFQRTATSVVKIGHIHQADTQGIQMAFLRELVHSKRIEFLQAHIESPETLARYLKPEQLIINASGTGLRSVFHRPETTPVRGDYVIATIPLKYIKHHPSRHFSFYTPGMTLHQRFNQDNMTIVFGATNIKGDGSTDFSLDHTTRILEHWYTLAHCPQEMSELHVKEECSQGSIKHSAFCEAGANAFSQKVLKALSKEPEG